MKKILLSMLSCLMAVGAMAVETTDYIKLSTATVNPGGDEVEITVSLVGSNTELYAGYNMDILLPEGLTPLKYSSYNEDDDEYSYYYCQKLMSSTGGINKSSHSVSSDIITIDGKRYLRVACISPENATLKANTGNLFKFKVKGSTFMKPGVLQITIDGVALKVAGGSEYDPESRVDENITISSSATASMNVSSSNKWSTCILPFETKLPDGVKAYTSTTSDKQYIHLTSASKIEAYTPYVLYSENGYTGTVSGTVNADAYPISGYVTAGNLNGSIVAQTITNGYVLQKQSDIVAFYKIKDGDSFTIPAGKCWMNIPSEVPSIGEAKALNLVIDDEETGVNAMSTNIETSNNIYTLDGRRVMAPLAKGIYVIGNKKMYVK